MIFLIEFKPSASAYPNLMPVEAPTRIEAWDKAVNRYGASVKDVHYKSSAPVGKIIEFGSTVTYKPKSKGVESDTEVLTFPLWIFLNLPYSR